MKIVVSSESTLDMSKETLKKFNIRTVPCSIILGSESRLDGEFPISDIFDYVDKEGKLPHTSAANQFQYEEHFKKLLEEYDAVIHVGLGSELSSTYRNALLAAQEYEGKVFLFDSKNLSGGIAIQAIYAAELVEQGLEPLDIIQKLKERVDTVQAGFVLEHVDYLYKGGRCSKMAMLGANIFHIRPQIIVKDGKLDAGRKYRGKFFDVVGKYIDDILEEYDNPDLKNICVNYTTLDDERILPMVYEKLRARGFKNIYSYYAGGTIASHCGPNTLGILYYNNK